MKATTEDDSGDEGKSAAKTKKITPRKAKKAKARATKAAEAELEEYRIAEGKVAEDFFTEFEEELMVESNDCSHRENGLWAFDTVNPNAWPGAADFLASTAADFVAVQEARVEACGVQDTESAARGLG